MTITIEDILSALCAQVTLVSSNDFQQIFLLNDSKEAKLACDILLAYGMEAKIYAEADHSRLYIAKPSADAQFDVALSYAKTLKTIKQSLDRLTEDSVTDIGGYTVTFANASVGKQIAIYLTPLSPISNQIQSTQAPQHRANASKPAAIPLKAGGKYMGTRPPNTEQEFVMASSLAKKYPTSASKEGKKKNDMKNVMSRVFVQYLASNSKEIFTAVFILLVLFTLLVMSKGFICPDLATKQNPAWYCHVGEEEDAKKPQKPK